MKQEKIWEYFQGEGAGVFSDSSARLDYLFRNVEKLSRGRRLRILNIGVGNGWLERRCLRAGMETYSLDPDEKAIEGLVAEGVSGRVGCIEEIPFSDRDFDAVFCSEVLEHLSAEQYRAGLREVRRVLKDDGLLVGTVPYKEDFPINMAVCPSCGTVFHRWGHVQVFDKIKLVKELKQEGYTIVVMRTRSFLNLSGVPIAGKVKASLHLLLGWLGLTIASPSLFFLARKEPGVHAGRE